MTEIEDRLQALYSDNAATDGVEARILAAFGPGSGYRGPAAGRPRRGLAAGAGAAAVVTLAGGIGVVAAVTHHSPGGSPAGRTALAPAVRTSVGVAHGGPVAPEPSVAVTPQVVVATAMSLLPATGTFSHLEGNYATGLAGGRMVYDDGHGRAQVTAYLTFPFTEDGRTVTPGDEPLCPADPLADQHCTAGPGGSEIMTYRGDDNISGGATHWEVAILRRDGVEIDISEYNAAQEKGIAPTRAEPPFTMAELRAVAASPRWQASVPATTARRDAHLFHATRS